MEEYEDSLIDEELLYALLNGSDEFREGIEDGLSELATILPADQEESSSPSEEVTEESDEEDAQLEGLSQEEEIAPGSLAKIFQAKEQEEPESIAENLTEKKPVKREFDSLGKQTVTVITKGTIIHGSMNSDCSLDVLGAVFGDIECAGSLTVTGHITGNISASEVYANTDRLDGSIMSAGIVKIGIGTVVIGDIKAASCVIAGAVKGNIDSSGSIVIDSTAIIKGNVTAKSIQMSNGAVLEGFCSLRYASVDIDTIFE